MVPRHPGFAGPAIRKFLSKPKIVYKVPFNDCPANYIGESKRTFNTRAKKHKRAIRNSDVDNNKMAEEVTLKKQKKNLCYEHQ